MIKLYSPKNEIELALLKGILDGEGVWYFVQNDHFGSLKVGPRIELFNAKTIMVPEERGELARELISQYLKSVQDDSRAVVWHIRSWTKANGFRGSPFWISDAR